MVNETKKYVHAAVTQCVPYKVIQGRLLAPIRGSRLCRTESTHWLLGQNARYGNLLTTFAIFCYTYCTSRVPQEWKKDWKVVDDLEDTKDVPDQIYIKLSEKTYFDVKINLVDWVRICRWSQRVNLIVFEENLRSRKLGERERQMVSDNMSIYRETKGWW